MDFDTFHNQSMKDFHQELLAIPHHAADKATNIPDHMYRHCGLETCGPYCILAALPHQLECPRGGS